MSHYPMIEISTKELDGIKIRWFSYGLVAGGVVTLIVCAILGLWIA